MKALEWMGDSLDILKGFPPEVTQPIGYAQYSVQCGEVPLNAKPLRKTGGIYEIVQSFDKETYRAVYIAKLKNAVYVLHCFQKKSKSGKKTPQKDTNLIKQRLKEARQRDKEVEKE